jgi:CubicO group peptidase (beta-lactamase class C family)
VLEAAAGVLNTETGAEARPDSVFQIGSITKSYTATLVMQLVDRGLLDLDAPVHTVLPEFRVADEEVTKNVTMRHLLAHSSGIQGDHFPDTGRGDDCIERFIETCSDLGQNHPLGATMSYCNTGYVIAGRVIERLTGASWDNALREHLLEPLGTQRTVTLPEEAIRFPAAFGHTVEPGQRPELAPAWMLPRSCGPAGLICSTAAEVISFARMHLDEGRGENGTVVLSPASVKAMQQEQVAVPDPYTLGSPWGLGWILFDWGGRRLIGHDGDTIGQSAFLRVDPDSRIAVALLTNGGNAGDLFREIYGEIFGRLAGVEMPVRPQPLAHLPAVDAERYVGTYERVALRIEVAERAGILSATSTVTGPLAALVPKTTETRDLLPAGEDLFVTREEGQETWTPVVFFDLEDGTRCIHMGARATPRVS